MAEVPIDELEKIEYENEKEIIEAIRRAVGHPRRFAMGLGRNPEYTSTIFHDRQPETVKRIFDSGTCEFRVNVLPYGNEEGHEDKALNWGRNSAI